MSVATTKTAENFGPITAGVACVVVGMRVDSLAQVVVYVNGSEDDAAVLGVDYTAALAEDRSGVTVTPLAPLAARASAITVSRKTGLTNDYALAPNGRISERTLVEQLDMLLMRLQEFGGLFARVLRLPVSGGEGLAALPSASARRGKLLGFADSDDAGPQMYEPTAGGGNVALQNIVGATAAGRLMAAGRLAVISRAADFPTFDAAALSVGDYIIALCHTSAALGGFGLWRLVGAPPAAHTAWLQTADGRYVELAEVFPMIEQFGAGVSSAQNLIAINAVYSLALANSASTAGRRGGCGAVAGKSYTLAGTVNLPIPVEGRFLANWHDTRAGGVLFDIGNTPYLPGVHVDWDLAFGETVADAQNTVTPTGIAPQATGGIGFRFRTFMSGKFRAASTRQFSFAAYYLDAAGDAFAPGDKQHIQHSFFDFGRTAYNGYGVLVRSKDPEFAAVQGNTFYGHFQTNWVHVDTGNAGAGPAATANNKWKCSFEKHAAWVTAGVPVGVGVSVLSSYDKFDCQFAETIIVMQAGAFQNEFRTQNTVDSGVTYYDNSGQITNRARFGVPQAGRTNKQIFDADGTPGGTILVRGQQYQNDKGIPQKIRVKLNPVPGPGQATSAQLDVKGPDGVWRPGPGSTWPATSTVPAHYCTLEVDVETIWYWRLTTSGTVGVVDVWTFDIPN